MPAPPARTIRSIVAMVPLLLVAVACASDPPAPPPAASAVTDPPTTTTTGPATTTTVAPKTVEEEVAAAYVAAEEAYFRALEEPGKPFVDLTEYWTGAALRQVRETLASLVDAGSHADANGPKATIRVLSVEATQGGSAKVHGCIVDPLRMVDQEGDLLDSSTASRLIVATVVDGWAGWVVTSIEETRTWQDGEGCDR